MTVGARRTEILPTARWQENEAFRRGTIAQSVQWSGCRLNKQGNVFRFLERPTDFSHPPKRARPALKPTQSPNQQITVWDKWPEREADQSTPYNAEVKNKCSYVITLCIGPRLYLYLLVRELKKQPAALNKELGREYSAEKKYTLSTVKIRLQILRQTNSLKNILYYVDRATRRNSC